MNASQQIGVPDQILPESYSPFERGDPLAGITGDDVTAEVAEVLGLPDGWPEPEPLSDALPDVMQFDPELMPESLRPLVEDVAERMQVPMDFPAVAAVATLAGVTNRRALIQPKRADSSWVETPNLWGAIVAPPGMLKSPLISCITKPALAIEKEWHAAYKAEEEAYTNAQELSGLDDKVWAAQYHSAKKAGKEPPPRPASSLIKPIHRRLITSDSTFEALHHILGENPAGLFVIRDEISGWMAGLDRQGREQERAFYLEAWNGNSSFTIDRIGRGSIHVPNVCLSMFGGIQPGKLRHYMADALRHGPSDDGLMQRLQLIVWPDSLRVGKYVDRVPDRNAISQAEWVFRQLTELDSENPLLLKFDDGAQELFQQWYCSLDKQLRDDGLSEGLQSHFSKYRKLMPALSLLFALADGRRDHVPLIHARKAAAWCDYLASHARRVYSSEASKDMMAAISLSRRLAGGWKREDGTFTVRDVYRAGWSSLSDPESARSALHVLTQYGWVREAVSVATIGRPSEQYLINPKVRRQHATQ